MSWLGWLQLAVDVFLALAVGGLALRVMALEGRLSWDSLPSVPVEPSADMRGNAQEMAAGLNSLISAGFSRPEAIEMLKFAISESLRREQS